MITQPDTIGTESTDATGYSEKTTFVIGDVHGHLHRLELLLEQEGLVEVCPDCQGSGEVLTLIPGPDPVEDMANCDLCKGMGRVRAREDVEIIMLGDVGHFGSENRSGDMLTYEYVDKFADLILWGNHDRAVFETHHHFSGYFPPLVETQHRMMLLQRTGRMALAAERHGYLLTHAGLHASFKYNKVDDKLKEDPAAFAEWVNEVSDPFANVTVDHKDRGGVVDSISHMRGGRQSVGGILWRDYEEKLYEGFRQVFGHSASRKHQVRRSNTGYGICIDIGGKSESGPDNCLAGIYLPDERIVRVDL